MILNYIFKYYIKTQDVTGVILLFKIIKFLLPRRRCVR